MDNITIKKGGIEDAQDFSQIILLSDLALSPFLFAPNPHEVMKYLFQQPGNLFSFEHTHFIEVNGKQAGMALAYNCEHKRREDLRTGLLLIKHLKWRFLARIPYLLGAQNIVGKLAENEHYLSNIAVYPEFRSLGLGTRLLLQVEQEAGKTGNNKVVLDVDTSNQKALKLYQRLGYAIERETPSLVVGGKTLKFFRLGKTLEL